MTIKEQDIRTLEERMNNGYALIEARKEAGYDVSKLEDFWIDLLHEYEAACDAFAKGEAA